MSPFKRLAQEGLDLRLFLYRSHISSHMLPYLKQTQEIDRYFSIITIINLSPSVYPCIGRHRRRVEVGSYLPIHLATDGSVTEFQPKDIITLSREGTVYL